MIKDANSRFDDYSISLKIYELVENDLLGSCFYLFLLC